MSIKPIFITQPDLPVLEELTPYLAQIWCNRILSNGGPFHEQLEDALCKYLGVPYISLFSNGTIALITALKALNITGEVITTPYSFVATAHSLLWNDIKPVFVDIDPVTLNIDPEKIEAAITSNTKAIMPVHVYGTPCDVNAIGSIAKKHNLKVIYDAAHAFAVRYHCGSILNHGDLSVLSFHATKVFNTFEGGAIVCQDAKTKQAIDQLKNFGFTSETMVVQAGINGKMNEFSAVVGLLQLGQINQKIEKRKLIDTVYRHAIKKISGIRCHEPNLMYQSNYSYFPIFVEDGYPFTRDEVYKKMKADGIHGRRYFYPLITDFPMYRNLGLSTKFDLPIANSVAERVICLPIYPDMNSSDQERVIDSLRHWGS